MCIRQVLIIDDEIAIPAQAEEFSSKFPVEGFEYIFADCWDNAEKIFSFSSPSLVLLDIRFEGIGDVHGLEILHKIRNQVPQIPVVMISSHQEPEILIKSWELGANSYIIKWSYNEHFL